MARNGATEVTDFVRAVTKDAKIRRKDEGRNESDRGDWDAIISTSDSG